MSDLILHHFDLSPFAEKARLMIGLKGLAWRSVEIPMIMPKPGLTALTGGYRKTPVLQIGADVYCDTRLIATELERRYPVPTLFPGGDRGMSLALSAWSDRGFFEAGAGLSMGLNKRGLPQAVIEDRKNFFNFMDFDRLESETPHLTAQLRAQAELIEQQLMDGRAFLFGDAPGLADINAYFPVWMVRGNVPGAEKMLGRYAGLARWEARMLAIGHGTRREMSASDAHAAARDATPSIGGGVDRDDPLGLKDGEDVSVTPDDYGRDPVRGRLAALSVQEVGVRRVDALVGEVIVHFPRVGYRIERL